MSESIAPLWLSHHHSDQAQRCIRFRGVHICRRCAILYPTVILSAVVFMALGTPSGPLLLIALSVLTAPFLVEWVGEQHGRLSYSPARQMAVTLLGGLGGGLAFAAHLQSPFNIWATVPLITLTVIAGVSALSGAVRRARTESQNSDWSSEFDQSEVNREQHLRNLLSQLPESADRQGSHS